MKLSREMCGLTQIEAAKRIGFEGSSGLSKIEAGTNRSVLPLWVIVSAAKVYEVSADWLLGLTDDWEPEARLTERATASWVFEAWEKARRRDIQAMFDLDKRIRAVAIDAGELANIAINQYFNVQSCEEANEAEWPMLRMVSPIRVTSDKLKKKGDALRRKLEKLGIHRKASAEQIAMCLIDPRLIPDEEGEHGPAD